MITAAASWLKRRMTPRPRRSALFVPAANPRAMDKARALPCDLVVLDLEDAVAPAAKAEARVRAAEAVRAGAYGGRELIVRCNGLDTPWGAEDLEALAEAGPDGVLAPKVGGPADLADYEAALASAPDRTRLWAMIETPAAVFALEPIAAQAAQAARRLEGLCLGLNDLGEAMGARATPDRAPFQAIMTLTVLAARAHGLAVLDAVFNGLDDPEGLAAACRQGSEFGFDGKCLIHPGQIEACHHAFGPSAEDVTAARAVVAAFATQGEAAGGAIRVDGRMVEALNLRRAEATLALAEAIAAPDCADGR